MRFEFNPASKFRGRTRGDFEPQKAHTHKSKPSQAGSLRKGKSSQARSSCKSKQPQARLPRYFSDGRTRRYLNLLVYSPL